MKSISLQVSPGDYEAFRLAAEAEGRSTADLIREAMVVYRRERIERGPALLDLPVLPGHEPSGPLPRRAELYDEVFAGKTEGTTPPSREKGPVSGRASSPRAARRASGR